MHKFTEDVDFISLKPLELATLEEVAYQLKSRNNANFQKRQNIKKLLDKTNVWSAIEGKLNKAFFGGRHSQVTDEGINKEDPANFIMNLLQATRFLVEEYVTDKVVVDT